MCGRARPIKKRVSNKSVKSSYLVGNKSQDTGQVALTYISIRPLQCSMKKRYDTLLDAISTLLTEGRLKAAYAINTVLVRTYWEIGKRIVEYEQDGKEKAVYGSRLLANLSHDLTSRYGRGFSLRNVQDMRRFYTLYKNWQTVSAELSWSHYVELIKLDDPVKRSYFLRYAAQEHLSIRDFKRQLYSFHYERLLMSKNKKALLQHEGNSAVPANSEEIIKDPYVLEFLRLKEENEYTEKEVESRILDNLQRFLLELGQGFTFVARQKRITIDNDHFYIDLLFYNIYLRCYVVIELKVGRFRAEDAGQLNFYLNYVREELNKEGDAPPIGIVLCTEKDTVHVRYALSGITNKLFVSKYKVYLPSQEELEQEVRRLL